MLSFHTEYVGTHVSGHGKAGERTLNTGGLQVVFPWAQRTDAFGCGT